MALLTLSRDDFQSLLERHFCVIYRGYHGYRCLMLMYVSQHTIKYSDSNRILGLKVKLSYQNLHLYSYIYQGTTAFCKERVLFWERTMKWRPLLLPSIVHTHTILVITSIDAPLVRVYCYLGLVWPPGTARAHGRQRLVWTNGAPLSVWSRGLVTVVSLSSVSCAGWSFPGVFPPTVCMVCYELLFCWCPHAVCIYEYLCSQC